MNLDELPTREVAKDMMAMISPIYDKSYVAKWLYEVMGVPLGLAKDTALSLREQAFPETATWSITYWEESYGIHPNESLSLEERRKQVIQKRNFRKPMNPARIEMLVENLCGRKTELVENVAPHTFEIKIAPGDTNANLGKIIDLINEVKQAQKSFRIVFDTPISIKIRAEPTSKSFPYRSTSTRNMAGRYPHTVSVGVTSQLQLVAAVDSVGVEFPYPISGTKPDISNQAAIKDGGLMVQADGTASQVLFKACGSRRKL